MSFDAIGIICNDINQTAKFYGVLGVEFKVIGGPDHLEGMTPSGIRIMLDSVDLIKKINPNWNDTNTGSRIVVCFKQSSSLEVNSVYNNIIQAGFRSIKEPWDAFWGQRYSSVEDPDGNQVDIFADLEK